MQFENADENQLDPNTLPVEDLIEYEEAVNTIKDTIVESDKVDEIINAGTELIEAATLGSDATLTEQEPIDTIIAQESIKNMLNTLGYTYNNSFNLENAHSNVEYAQELNREAFMDILNKAKTAMVNAMKYLYDLFKKLFNTIMKNLNIDKKIKQIAYDKAMKNREEIIGVLKENSSIISNLNNIEKRIDHIHKDLTTYNSLNLVEYKHHLVNNLALDALGFDYLNLLNELLESSTKAIKESFAYILKNDPKETLMSIVEKHCSRVSSKLKNNKLLVAAIAKALENSFIKSDTKVKDIVLVYPKGTYVHFLLIVENTKTKQVRLSSSVEKYDLKDMISATKLPPEALFDLTAKGNELYLKSNFEITKRFDIIASDINSKLEWLIRDPSMEDRKTDITNFSLLFKQILNLHRTYISIGGNLTKRTIFLNSIVKK